MYWAIFIEICVQTCSVILFISKNASNLQSEPDCLALTVKPLILNLFRFSLKNTADIRCLK